MYPGKQLVFELDSFRQNIRRATNPDCPRIIKLIDQVLMEWDDRVCLDGSELDLTDVENSYWKANGGFFVLEVQSEIVGTHGILPVNASQSVCTFKRLYVDPRYRGTGAGADLMDWNIEWAQQQGFKKIEFWSDTRFERAHRFFEKLGFETTGEKREMHDSHHVYWEYYFSKKI